MNAICECETPGLKWEDTERERKRKGAETTHPHTNLGDFSEQCQNTGKLWDGKTIYNLRLCYVMLADFLSLSLPINSALICAILVNSIYGWEILLRDFQRCQHFTLVCWIWTERIVLRISALPGKITCILTDSI